MNGDISRALQEEQGQQGAQGMPPPVNGESVSPREPPRSNSLARAESDGDLNRFSFV